ncbi:cupredoxin domain-containing protein [Pseudalkalibacillus sp. SCS-8]|uniref:cupredoxin domain-containing protein n=1 Tax=Pseudalkalibacillus nanhaiensis TaxID=3115291 RepID=UPI0032DAC8CD
MKIKRLPFLFAISLLMIGLLVACGSDENDQTAENEKTQPTEEQQESDDQDQEGADNNDQQASEGEDATNGNTIKITASEMKFEPSTIKLKKDQEYEFVMTNEGQVFHDFVEDELEIEMISMSEMPEHPEQTSMIDKLLGTKKAYAHGDKKDMKTLHMNSNPGDTVSIKFIPKETGTFEFYCSVPGHKEAGMKGTIIVEE